MLQQADVVLFDTVERGLLYPFTQTRPVAGIRFGIFTSKERWECITGKKVDILTAAYLQSPVSPLHDEALFINAAVLPGEALLKLLKELKYGEAIVHENRIIAFAGSRNTFNSIEDITISAFHNIINYSNDIIYITYPWQLFLYNDKAIRFDFELLTKERQSQPISKTNRVIAPENIFIEDGAVVEHAVINASSGPVYIDRNAMVMEGCMIRGPLAMCEAATLKMGTAVYGATTIGPYSMAGGEIKNSIIMGYSNKAHHGYLGDAVIGEWCNLGAGTSNSNVKNDAGDILQHTGNDALNIGLKCGVMMGDYCRTAINTSLNTATFAGVACNIFGSGLTPRQIPGFTWGVTERYIFEKALQHIDNWKKLKGERLTDKEIEILNYLYKTTL